MNRRTGQQGLGTRRVEGASWRLIDEVRYIQGRAAEHDSRIVTAGPLVLFSAESGDAWMLDPSDQLATPLARDGDPLPVQIEETNTRFTIAWQGQYRIDGQAFVYREKDSGRVRAILGYPIQLIAKHAGSAKISNIFG